VPAAVGFGLVVATDEFPDLLVADGAAFAMDALIEPRAVAIDEEPLPATAEAQPAVDRRHVGPAGHRLQDLLIHRTSPDAARSRRVPGAAARPRSRPGGPRRNRHGHRWADSRGLPAATLRPGSRGCAPAGRGRCAH